MYCLKHVRYMFTQNIPVFMPLVTSSWTHVLLQNDAFVLQLIDQVLRIC